MELSSSSSPSVTPPAPPVSELMLSKATSVTAFNTVSGHFAPMRLHFAINSGDLAKVEYLIESGVDVNFAAPSNGQTPLILSVLSQRIDMAAALLEAGADVCVAEKTSWRRRPIHLAARAGHCALVPDMLRQSRGEVWSVDAMLFTPLHNAAVSGHLDVARLLVNAGAEVDTADDRGRTLSSVLPSTVTCRSSICSLVTEPSWTGSMHSVGQHCTRAHSVVTVTW